MSNERFELNKNLAQMLKGGVIMDELINFTTVQ